MRAIAAATSALAAARVANASTDGVSPVPGAEAALAAAQAPLPPVVVGSSEVVDILLIDWSDRWDVNEQMQDPVYNWNGIASYEWSLQTPKQLEDLALAGITAPPTYPDFTGWRLGALTPIGFGDKNPTAPTQLSKLIDVFFVRKTFMKVPGAQSVH